MLNKRSLALAGALTVLPQVVLAAAAGQCVDVSVPKQAIEARNGKWIELTPEQWEFLRGIYAMNPLTPPGLPYGDKAALAKVDGNSGGLVFFIEGLILVASPGWVKRAMTSALETPDNILRIIGIGSAFCGLILIWAIRH